MITETIEVLKDLLKEYELRAKYNGGHDYRYYRGLTNAIKELEGKASASLINNRNNLPPVTPTQNWIPTSERQPEENGNYLAFYRSSDGTAALEFVMVDHCNAGGGWLHEKSGKKSYKKVIAWMPLPKPYQSEVSE